MANISSPNCNKMLIFGKWPFFIMYFLKILMNPIILNICDVTCYHSIGTRKQTEKCLTWGPFLENPETLQAISDVIIPSLSQEWRGFILVVKLHSEFVLCYLESLLKGWLSKNLRIAGSQMAILGPATLQIKPVTFRLDHLSSSV